MNSSSAKTAFPYIHLQGEKYIIVSDENRSEFDERYKKGERFEGAMDIDPTGLLFRFHVAIEHYKDLKEAHDRVKQVNQSKEMQDIITALEKDYEQIKQMYGLSDFEEMDVSGNQTGIPTRQERDVTVYLRRPEEESTTNKILAAISLPGIPVEKESKENKDTSVIDEVVDLFKKSDNAIVAKVLATLPQGTLEQLQKTFADALKQPVNESVNNERRASNSPRGGF